MTLLIEANITNHLDFLKIHSIGGDSLKNILLICVFDLLDFGLIVLKSLKVLRYSILEKAVSYHAAHVLAY